MQQQPRQKVLYSKAPHGHIEICLNRPRVRNAFDEQLIAQLDQALARAEADPDLRLLVLRGKGKLFSAGADLDWMRRMGQNSDAENRADALRLAECLQRLYRLPVPTIAVVQGGAFGGGLGLIACCDFAIAVQGARFGFSEVFLGLIPATISPFVVRAMGERAARSLFVSGARFNATDALRLGLLTATTDNLERELAALIKSLSANSHSAMVRAKTLAREVASRPLDQELAADTADWIADARAGPDARDRIAAFLKKGNS